MLNKILLILILLINIGILGILYATNPSVITDAFGSGRDDSGLTKEKKDSGIPSENDGAAVTNPGQDNNPSDTAAPLVAPEGDKANKPPANEKKETEQKPGEGQNAGKQGQATQNPPQPSPPQPANNGSGAKPGSALYEELPGFYDSRLSFGAPKADLN